MTNLRSTTFTDDAKVGEIVRSSQGVEAVADYSTVQGLLRGLDVIMALNRIPGASASATQLSAATTLHRTTVKRLLETLKGAGFVTYEAEKNCYRVTSRVRQLSQGWRPEDVLCEVALPPMRQLTQRFLWPCALLTRDRDRLLVRESTHRFSPLSFHSGVLGASVPLVRTASGLAYLAFCGDQERELLLAMLRERDDYEGEFARNAGEVRRQLAATRERGFAVNEGNYWTLPDRPSQRGGTEHEGPAPEDGRGRYGAVAVPVRGSNGVAGCMNILFSKRAIKIAEAVTKYAPELLAAAATIEAQLRE